CAKNAHYNNPYYFDYW
nr:immunoglobulin heavy chain junction region [Mus musculus]MBK4188083.1 immunoglobulin heavy chain junction region [Mus musculus]